jgi:hypothetical protein
VFEVLPFCFYRFNFQLFICCVGCSLHLPIYRRQYEFLHGILEQHQNLLLLSISLATCIIVFDHVFLFPLYDMMPKKKEMTFLGNFEQSLCTTNLKPVKIPLYWKYHCPRDGIVTVAQGGCLGNQMWEYASTWAVARRTELEPYVPRCICRVLNEMFEDLKSHHWATCHTALLSGTVSSRPQNYGAYSYHALQFCQIWSPHGLTISNMSFSSNGG